jgi:hypothetical protein
MPTFRPNGWQRAGIVLALIWIVIAGSWGWNHAYDGVDADFKQCVAAIKAPPDLQACRDARNGALAVPRGVSAAIVAFGPVLAVWLVCYGLILFYRRIRRGPGASNAA